MAKSIHRAEYDVFRALLREKRTASGLTQADVSLRMRRSQSFISDAERGVRRVDVLELRDLCALFDVRLTKFCEEFERRIAAIDTLVGMVHSTKRRSRPVGSISRVKSSKQRQTRP